MLFLKLGKGAIAKDALVVLVLINMRNRLRQLRLRRGEDHGVPLYLVTYVVVDLVGKHVDDGAQTLLLPHFQVLMVVAHNNIEQILIVQPHPLTLKVVVFEFLLKSDCHPALAGKFE